MITHLVGWATDKISLHFWNSKKHFKYNIIPNMRDTNIITKRYNSSPFKRNKRDELSPICIPWCNHRSPSLWCVVLLRFIQYFVIKMHFFQRTEHCWRVIHVKLKFGRTKYQIFEKISFMEMCMSYISEL